MKSKATSVVLAAFGSPHQVLGRSEGRAGVGFSVVAGAGSAFIKTTATQTAAEDNAFARISDAAGNRYIYLSRADYGDLVDSPFWISPDATLRIGIIEARY